MVMSSRNSSSSSRGVSTDYQVHPSTGHHIADPRLATAVLAVLISKQLGPGFFEFC
jgi:hypothetical protein